MKRLYLTAEEKAHLESLHVLKENGKERDRIKAILLHSEGWTVPMISQALRLHESTIIRHINEYKEGKLKSSGGGSESHLNQEMTEKLIGHLETNTYHHAHEIIQYIKNTFGIEYTVPGMNKWLHRNSFSYKKPKGHPHIATVIYSRIPPFKRGGRLGRTHIVYGFSPSKPGDKNYLWLDKNRPR